MNNLAYTSQDPATIGPKVEEKVREEVGASAPLPFQVEAGEAATVSVGSFLGDVAGALETLQRLLTVTSPRQPKPLHPLQVMGLLHNHYRRLARMDDPDVVDVACQPGEHAEHDGGIHAVGVDDRSHVLAADHHAVGVVATRL